MSKREKPRKRNVFEAFFGGGVDFKAEHRHRGMKFGIAPHFPDVWGRKLAAGGGKEIRTLVGVSPNGFQGTSTGQKMTDFAR